MQQVLRNPRICGYRSRRVREFNPETGHRAVDSDHLGDRLGGRQAVRPSGRH
ncbi:hypothetical protein [Streptomyces sp. AS02]|uniref:hypothetical protein n=1 Tax=Streptomyces sp. AS02 TaxID=2938946 RepID=UPI0034D6FA43